MSSGQRRRGPPAALRIETPISSHITVQAVDGSASASETDSPKPRSLRNMKNLSLSLPSAQSSTSSLAIEQPPRPRRPSVISLPTATTSTAILHRKEELGSPTVPYVEGPIQILPGIWLGSEENARDWKGLIERGIRAILNVAKEVVSPFDSDATARSLRHTVSSPNLKQDHADDDDFTYYPPNPATGRPGMYYLKLMWSHGQQDLVENGFQAAMTFTDAAIERGDGVLIHCQCGISRSATMVIALVMRAAAERAPSVPPEIWALKGMQGAYTYVKDKSRWIGPNMSLIYQLLDYERKLRGDSSPSASERSSIADEEEEWGRRRRMLDEGSDDPQEERESSLVLQEAQALDKAMEDRVVARKSSASSVASSSGVGMGAAWRSRYGGRKRAGSIASSNSVLSEDLVEENEEQELLGTGGGFDSDRATSLEPELTSAGDSPEGDTASSHPMSSTATSLDSTNINSRATPIKTPLTARPRVPVLRPPPSVPIWKTSFNLPPPPATATRSTFDIPPRMQKSRKRPAPILPPVPSSPVGIIIDNEASDSDTSSMRVSLTSHKSKTSTDALAESANRDADVQSRPPSPIPSIRHRTDSIRKPAPPPLHLRSSVVKRANRLSLQSIASNASSGSSSTSTTASFKRYSAVSSSLQIATPSQTLFVFPPSPTHEDSKTSYANMARTPSTMTLTTSGAPPFPPISTPRVSTFRGAQGRTRSFIGLGPGPAPTTAFSKVDARGYVGLE